MSKRLYGTVALFVRTDRCGREMSYRQWRTRWPLVKRKLGSKPEPGTRNAVDPTFPRSPHAPRDREALVRAVALYPAAGADAGDPGANDHDVDMLVGRGLQVSPGGGHDAIRLTPRDPAALGLSTLAGPTSAD
jgi:hypothetical protein